MVAKPKRDAVKPLDDRIAAGGASSWDQYGQLLIDDDDRETVVETKIVEVERGIHKDENGVSWHGNFGWSKRGLHIKEGLTTAEYFAFSGVIEGAGQALSLVVGDWVANGEIHQRGVTYQMASEYSGLTYETVKNSTYVCKAVPLSFRNDKLTIAHYQLVAGLKDEPDKQQRALAVAASGNGSGKPFTVAEFRAWLKGKPQIEKTVRTVTPTDQVAKEFQQFRDVVGEMPASPTTTVKRWPLNCARWPMRFTTNHDADRRRRYPGINR